ncbi:MAG TPA: FHA domain-containing protein [Thermoanaerobaculia bacterium]|nr:FHA domain-containing protein [Thermoanaerobaculia bacterium]
MREELGQIDISPIAELVRIKAEEEVLRERLAKMESAKEKVSTVVYKRVHADYQTRQAALDAESRPLKDRTRREYQKLLGLRQQVERSVEEASLEKEELEFRRDLGEFPGDQFKQRLKECEMKLAERRLELEDTDKIKEQFLGAFHSAEELEAPAAAVAPARPAPAREPSPAALSDGGTVIGQGASRPAAPSVGGETVIGHPLPAPAVSPDATQLRAPAVAAAPARPAPSITGTQPMPAPSGASAGATVVMSMPRLVHMTDGKPAEEYVLKPGATAIGRSLKSQIHLPQSAVSRHHADIVFGPEGYKVVDMGSPNGVSVNGQKIKEHVLQNGDVIVVGMEKLVYKV